MQTKGRVHLIDPERSRRWPWPFPLCGISRPKTLTDDEGRVTCQRCLETLSRRCEGDSSGERGR